MNMNDDNNNSLTQLQRVLLDELKWFDSFCQKHNLTYYAIGGTLLGAMRHNGFIPWDDDIDVGMPRKDYDRLQEFVEVSGRYMLETHYSNRKDFCYPYAKIYDTQTTLIEHKRVNVIRGAFIDIFPIDGIGNSLDESYAKYKIIKRWYHFYLSIVAGVRKGRSIKKNAAVLAARMIPFAYKVQSRIRMKLNALCAQSVNSECLYGGNLLGAYGQKEIVEMSLFGVPKRHRFEDIMINCPFDSDGYLSRIYNDWRLLPPPQKRISHHDFSYLDLNKSFLTRLTNK